MIKDQQLLPNKNLRFFTQYLIKISLVALLCILSPFITYAKLSDSQIDQVIEKISEACPDFDPLDDGPTVIDYFDKNSIDSGSFLPPLNLTIKSCPDHKLRIFSERIFLDGVDISTISQNILVNQNVTNSNATNINQAVNTGNGSLNQNNIWVELFLSKGTLVGTIIGLIVCFIRKIIFSWRGRKKKQPACD